MRLVTWNTLHRIHAANWKEAPIDVYPVETARIDAIVDTIISWLSHDVDVVCLQEVSGDLLVRLREASARAGGDAVVFDHRFPRVPRMRDGSPSPLRDPSEHLVVLTRDPRARVREARTFDTDPGKGVLAVEVGFLTVLDTHVSFGERSAAQLVVLADIARAARASGSAVAVLGDFNAPAEAVRAGLGETFAVSVVEGPTRIATGDHAGKTIDHVAVLGATLGATCVLSAEGSSDHNPVVADVALG